MSDTVAILNHGVLVAQAPIDDLLRGSGGASFSLAFRGGGDRVRQRLEQQSWVSSLTVADANGSQHLQVAVRDEAAAESGLLRLVMADPDVTVLEFGRTRHNLEAVLDTTWKRFSLTSCKETGMVAEVAFKPTRGQGWLCGLVTLVRHEMQAFWGTRSWWAQLAVWSVFVQGLLLNALAQAHGGLPGTEFVSVAMGTFGVFGVIVLTHNAIVGEKQSGTAAWIMSKPASRSAFILARFLGAISGYVAVVIAIEGAGAYAVLALSGHQVSAPAYAAAMLSVAVCLLFFEALSLFLGTLFNSRGPVLAIPLVALLLGQLFHLDLASIGAALLPAGPSAISVSANSGGSVATAAVAVSAIYLMFTAGLLAAAIIRFTREEF